MGTIEKFLHEHFASLDADDTDTQEGADNAAAAAQILPDFVPETLEQPFAKVNSVVDGSPAADAGLQAGDQIRTFGYVDHANHDGLKKVGECVAGNEGVSYPSLPLLFPAYFVLFLFALQPSTFANLVPSNAFSSRSQGAQARVVCKSSA